MPDAQFDAAFARLRERLVAVIDTELARAADGGLTPTTSAAPTSCALASPRPSRSAGTRSRPWSAPATTRPGWHDGLASARGRSPSGPRGMRCWRAAPNPGPGATLRCSSTSEATHFRTWLSCSGCWRAPATRGAGAPHCGWPRPHRIFRTAPPRHPGCNTAATRAPCWPPQRPTPPAGTSNRPPTGTVPTPGSSPNRGRCARIFEVALVSERAHLRRSGDEVGDRAAHD